MKDKIEQELLFYLKIWQVTHSDLDSSPAEDWWFSLTTQIATSTNKNWPEIYILEC